MSGRRPARRKTHVTTERPPFERIALILQGGGALGSYQAGVYQALAEADLHPDWVAGISIGAINAALIAGNPPEKRVERLREFWETVSASPLGIPYLSICELVEYRLEDIDLKGAWTGPAELTLFSHALAPLAELPVLEVVSGIHIIADLTLGLGKVVHDYLA